MPHNDFHTPSTGPPEDPINPNPPPPSVRTVTEAWADAADAMAERRDELQEMLDNARRAREPGEVFPGGLNDQSWIATTNPLLLDFSALRRRRFGGGRATGSGGGGAGF